MIGINPTVDYAFKRLLGSPEFMGITVHFLNAVLKLIPRIVRATTLNPILDKENADDKVSILDIRAEDELGRQFNIEMQKSIPAGLSQRLVYYASSIYSSQLIAGMEYASLRPAISICVLTKSLFPNIPQLHFDFRLRQADGLLLSDDLQVHLVELAKLKATRNNVHRASPLEQWAFFFRYAEFLELHEIERLLPDPIFLEAAGVLRMIARTPEENWRYIARKKLELDTAAREAYASEQGRQEGRQEGLAHGEQIGQILLLQELLGDQQSPVEELLVLNSDDLANRRAELRRRLRDRGE